MSDIRLHYPLEWPSGWKRQPWPSPSPFSKSRSFAAARDFTGRELRLLKCSSIEVSSNIALNIHGSAKLGQAQPKDRGVAVYFQLAHKDCVLACDEWDRVECNLYAIGKHVEAMRAQHRYRVGSVEQSFSGYLRLPGTTTTLPWWAEALGVSATPTQEEADAAFHRQAMQHHPDKGGSDKAMAHINLARDAAQKWLGGAQ